MKKNEIISLKNTEDQHPNDPPMGPETKPTMPKGTVKIDVSDVYDWYKLGQHISNLKGLGKHDFGKGPPSAIISFGSEDIEHEFIQDLLKLGLSTTDIDPAGHSAKKGQKTDPTYNVEDVAEGKFRANDIEEFKPSNDALDNLKSKYLPDWEMLDHRTLQAKYVADDHRAAVAFVKIINRLSEKMDHFCEVTQDVAEVTVKTSTFDVKGLTLLDFQIAMVIDRFASDVGIKQMPMSGNFGMHENFADGKNPGRKGLAKRSGVNCKQSVTKLRSVAKNSSGEKARMAHWCANMKSGRNK
jgi:pterin-4a-carbinolamine dehydratase